MHEGEWNMNAATRTIRRWEYQSARVAAALRVRMRQALRRESGQGTTEYAILVGVLVVIAIVAITLFKPKIQQLWDAIASGINGL
jgi:Flp pilus assembly pilin Flp